MPPKFKHGMCEFPEYQVWQRMKNRCHNKNAKDYERYGGIGIKVCDSWMESFKNFIDDMGIRPKDNYQIDRINTLKGYYRENCRWVSRKVNAQNTRKSHRWYIKGRVFESRSDCCKYFNVTEGAVRYWIKTREDCWSEKKYK